MYFEDYDQDGIQIYKARFHTILQSQQYRDQIKEISENIQEFNVFEFNLDDINSADKNLFQLMLNQPIKNLLLLEECIIEQIKEDIIDQDLDFDDQFKIRLDLKGNLGRHTLTPRGLKSCFVNKLVKVQGIVTYMSQTQVRLLKSAHYCQNTNKFSYQEYNDILNLQKLQQKTSKNIPLYDEHHNPLSFEFGMCSYKDYQVIGIQEEPENTPVGLLSRKINVILQGDLVNSTKPGDKIQIIGIYRPLTNSQTYQYGLFQKVIQAFSIESLIKKPDQQQIEAKEIQDIQKISQRNDLIDLFIRSLFPSIYGNNFVKEALLMQLLGGNEIIIQNGMRIRGDINILLIGDPSTGKSQFLRKMLSLHSISINTTGRGTSGVGLTAAIVNDNITKEKVLEAGAMVLADRGLVCIDEFDKMNPEDRVAMHEVMEQQTVTIAKGGIHMSLNARCSILAAANPVFGEYVMNKSPSENIGLRDTLLSRFDLIFIMIDNNDEEKDKNLAERVTNNHRFTDNKVYHSLLTKNGIIEQDYQESGNIKYKGPFDNYNQLFHSKRNLQYLSKEFLTKYLQYIKNINPPILTQEGADYITQKWSYIRNVEMTRKKLVRIMPLTIRSLESLIRLSTAYAKLRLSKIIELQDCVQAIKLFLKSFYGGYKKIDPNFFQNEIKYLSYGRKTNNKKLQKSKANFYPKKDEKIHKKKTKKIEENSEVSSVIEKMSRRSKRNFNKKKRLIYQIIYENSNQSSKKKSKNDQFTLNQLWQYIIANLPNPKYDNINFEERNDLQEVLTELEAESKILIEEDKIYIIQIIPNLLLLQKLIK